MSKPREYIGSELAGVVAVIGTIVFVGGVAFFDESALVRAHFTGACSRKTRGAKIRIDLKALNLLIYLHSGRSKYSYG